MGFYTQNIVGRLKACVISPMIAGTLITDESIDAGHLHVMDFVTGQLEQDTRPVASSFDDILEVFNTALKLQRGEAGLHILVPGDIAPLIVDKSRGDEQFVEVFIHTAIGTRDRFWVLMYIPYEIPQLGPDMNYGIAAKTDVYGGRSEYILFIKMQGNRQGVNRLPSAYYTLGSFSVGSADVPPIEDAQHEGEVDERIAALEREREAADIKLNDAEEHIRDMAIELERSRTALAASEAEREVALDEVARLRDAAAAEALAVAEANGRLVAERRAENEATLALAAELRAKSDEVSQLIAELRAKSDDDALFIAELREEIVAHEADTVHNLALIEELNEDIARMHSEDVEKCEWANEEMAALRAMLQVYEGAQFAGCDQYSPCCEPLFAGYDHLSYPCYGPQSPSHGLYTPFDRSNDGYLPYAGGHGQ